MIKMNSIQSTSIAQIGYKYRTMNVVFQNGKTYVFKKVPRALFDQLMSSISKGKFFNQHIKEVYPFTSLT